jgi:hypothetical protein
LTCRVEWCNHTVWAWLSKYWNSDEFMKKRKRAQASRWSIDDPAPNRGGSRNFSETQQYLVCEVLVCYVYVIDIYLVFSCII